MIPAIFLGYLAFQLPHDTIPGAIITAALIIAAVICWRDE